MSSLLLPVAIVLTLCLLAINPSYQASHYSLQSTNNATSIITAKNLDFVLSIDAATSNYIRSKNWTACLSSFKIIFPVPDCTPTIQYPKVFNFSSNVLKCCYESNALYPWPYIHETAGQLLVAELNKQYNLDLKVAFIKVNTTQYGYFNSLKREVDSGNCDVAIASTNIDDSRKAQAHFQCAYGTSFNAYLRSELDPEINVVNETGLNRPGLKVAVYKATTYDTWATKNLPLATIVRFSGGYYEVWPMILNKEVHAVITDGADLFAWLDVNKANCTSCKVGLFGESFSYGSFVTNQYDYLISGSLMNGISMIFAIMISLCLLLWL